VAWRLIRRLERWARLPWLPPLKSTGVFTGLYIDAVLTSVIIACRELSCDMAPTTHTTSRNVPIEHYQNFTGTIGWALIIFQHGVMTTWELYHCIIWHCHLQAKHVRTVLCGYHYGAKRVTIWDRVGGIWLWRSCIFLLEERR
jgi:hypothetical protein